MPRCRNFAEEVVWQRHLWTPELSTDCRFFYNDAVNCFDDASTRSWIDSAHRYPVMASATSVCGSYALGPVKTGANGPGSALSFSGSGQLVSQRTGPDLQNYTSTYAIMFVSRWDNLDTDDKWSYVITDSAFSTGHLGSSVLGGIVGNYSHFWQNPSIGGVSTEPARGTWSVGDWWIGAHVYDGGSIYVYKNGVQVSSKIVTPSAMGSLVGVALATDNGVANIPARFSTISFASFGFFGNYLIREKVEGYLAWKWGLYNLLPGTHRFASRPPVIGD